MAKQKPDRQVRMVSIDQLQPYARNSRTHSDAQIDQIISSLREFGWTNPVLIDEKQGIIAGHARVEAAKRLGLTEVPCIELSGLSEAQKRAYVITDNKLALNAGWDEKLLALELGELKELDFNTDLTGFSAEELEALFAKVEASAGLTDPDAVPDPPKEPATFSGDLWVMGKHRLLCGDSTNPQHVDRLMGGVTPGLMVTDPPYGVEYDPTWRDEAGGKFGDGKTKMRGKVSNDDRADWSEAFSLFQGDVAYIWHASLKTAEVLKSLEDCGFERRSQIIWAKQHFTLMRTGYHWQHEPCWYMTRRGRKTNWTGDRKQTTIWEIKSLNPAGSDHTEVKTGHGTQKPIECMRRPIVNHTNPGQCVYDPFLGSGTTLIAAESIGRICLGMEIVPIYCDVIVERWQDFTGKHATLEGDGRTFDEIKAQRTGGAMPVLQSQDIRAVS